MKRAQSKNINVEGPFPSDTIFLESSRKNYDGIITMYHDQGQIAIKLLGFDGGVTVQGGLPVVIATPAHGTAFNIVGKNIASPASSQNALDVAIAIGSRRAAKRHEDRERQLNVMAVKRNGVSITERASASNMIEIAA